MELGVFFSSISGKQAQRLSNESWSSFVAFIHFFTFPPNRCFFLPLFAVDVTE